MLEADRSDAPSMERYWADVSTAFNEATGLALRPAAGATIWRIAKTSFGALNPEERKTGSKAETWGRYDVRQHRTIYGASPIETAYGESLAWARMKLTLDQPQLRELFDDVDPDDTTSLREQVQQDWESPRAHAARQRSGRPEGVKAVETVGF